MKLFKGRTLYTDILEMWWPKHETTLMDTTATQKKLYMTAHIIPALGAYPVKKITPDILCDYINKKLEHGSPLRHPTGLAPSTVKGHFKVIKPSLDWAVEHKFIKENPCNYVKLPKVERPEIIPFTEDEIVALISAARPKWLGDVIDIAWRTGMRRGEIFGLKWTDIDFDRKTLIVNRSVNASAPNQRLVHPPKTASSRRAIMLDNKTMEILQKRKMRTQSDWVLTNQYDLPISQWYVPKYMHQACINAGVKPRCFHTLRHSHATHLIINGVNPKLVQARLGHSSVTMTLETYTYASLSMQSQIVDIFNNVL